MVLLPFSQLVFAAKLFVLYENRTLTCEMLLMLLTLQVALKIERGLVTALIAPSYI